MLRRNFAGVDLPPNSPFREISSHKFRARPPPCNSPPTEPVDAVLAAAAGRGRKRSAAAPASAPRPPRSGGARLRGPGGRFLSGVNNPGYRVGVWDASGNERVVDRPGGVGVSKAARLRNIRAQRAVVLQAIRQARAERRRDGTIKKLKEASRQLLNRSKLTRGL